LYLTLNTTLLSPLKSAVTPEGSEDAEFPIAMRAQESGAKALAAWHDRIGESARDMLAIIEKNAVMLDDLPQLREHPMHTRHHTYSFRVKA